MANLEVLSQVKAKGAESKPPEDRRKDAVSKHQEIVVLNVGGKRFSTSRQTLTWIPDSFFTSLMSGRIPSLKDETGAIFIDRDPECFGPILNFMRTRNVDLRNIDLKTLKHEAEFFGLLPLVKRLSVCDELEKSNCGSFLFYCQLNPPVFESLPSNFGAVYSHDGIIPPHPLHQGLVRADCSRQVVQLIGHGNCIAIAYNHCICVLGVRESRGWEVIFSTPLLDKSPQRMTLDTRSMGSGVILAAVVGFEIKVWTCSPSSTSILASFDMKIQVDGLFFIGKQLVAISNTGKVVVWQSVQKHWQMQEVEQICSYDTAGSFLLLGCTNGSIYYIDMEKFPVRMKDNDLLVTQLFEDPCKDPITALSVYVTPNIFPGSGQNWMEVAYGTQAGTVRVVVRHPENIGQAPQIFQSYNVHTCPIMRVVLGEKHLISVCAENHVRSWTVTRFRGRISTQPGSTPIASFKVLSLEGARSLFYPVNSIGPFGERDEEQVFIQRVIPETSIIFVRSSSTGNRICRIESVDGSNISAYYVHECEAVNRTGLRSRRFIFTGHSNGSVQVWDLTAALELANKATTTTTAGAADKCDDGGPSKSELLELLQNCDVSPASNFSSTFSSRAPSPSPSLMSIMYPSIRHLPGTRGRLQASPLSTPAMNIRRSKSEQNSGNMFQPISLSHSNSNASFNESASLKETNEGSVPCDELPPPNDGHSPEAESAEEEQKEPDAGERLMQSERRCTSSHSREETFRFKVDTEGSVHQRSRSNEMDYVSLRSNKEEKRTNVHSFKRPPSSIQVSEYVDCGEEGNDPAQSDVVDSSVGSPPYASNATKERECWSEPREDYDSTHSLVVKDKRTGDATDERFSWLKDFDSSLWSNYFTSPLDNSLEQS